MALKIFLRKGFLPFPHGQVLAAFAAVHTTSRCGLAKTSDLAEKFNSLDCSPVGRARKRECEVACINYHQFQALSCPLLEFLNELPIPHQILPQRRAFKKLNQSVPEPQSQLAMTTIQPIERLEMQRASIAFLKEKDSDCSGVVDFSGNGGKHALCKTGAPESNIKRTCTTHI